MIERLEHELAQLVMNRMDAARAGKWALVKTLDNAAEEKRRELAQAHAQVNTMIRALWPGAKVR